MFLVKSNADITLPPMLKKKHGRISIYLKARSKAIMRVNCWFTIIYNKKNEIISA